MKQLYLIAVIAGEHVALPAGLIDSVVKVREAVPVPSVGPFVAGLFALRSRVLTLIDCQYFVTGDAAEVARGQPAVVVVVAGCAYGLLVDAVIDVIDTPVKPGPLRGQLPAGWGAIGTGLLELADTTYLLIDPEYLVNPAARRAA